MDAATRTQLQDGMRRLAEGDRSAFAPVFALLWPALRAFVQRQCPSDADDVAQEALLKVFSRCAELDPERDALAWAIGIAAWEVRTTRRRAQRRREEPAPEADSFAEESHEGRLIDLDLERAALDVVGSLAPGDAETLRCLLSGRRPEIPGATFRKRVERALRRFRLAWSSRHGMD